jgi:hypothetical protein
MFLARQYACAATASLLIAGGFIVSFLSAVHAAAEGSSATCQDAAGIAVLPAPIAPWKGAPLRVLFAADKPLDGELSLIAPNGSIAAKSSDRNGGPPYFWFAEVAVPAAGTWRATLVLERIMGLAASFAHYFVAAGVQSGNGRTLASDSNTDFYPVRLTQETLRPGTIYADPYGHILMIVRRVPESGGRPGVFLAVDAEPDGTVARKRFWRGNFLFAQYPGLESPGFKRFRPILRDKTGALRRLTNSEIAKDLQYGDFSLEQSQLGVDAFYDRMDDVMSPEPLDPRRAIEDAIASLDEQVRLRVTAVENGRKYQDRAHGEVGMPNGPSIFQTSGAWEDYSTPARDFRLLIAIDVVRGFPDRVARRPERYAMPAGKSVAEVKAELQNVLASEFATRKFSYARSDGSAWTITLKDVVDRAADLEMGYNPNDCVEVRWGAPADSEETSTCRGHAPQAQRAKMMGYRNWFRERHWPHA